MPAVGKPIPHDSATGHVTGAALYIDDLPLREDELHVGFVGGPVAAGRIVSLELAAARAVEGVIGVFTSADVPGENEFGLLLRDEPFLAAEELLYLGQPVVLVAAETREALVCGVDAVEIQAEGAAPILSIEKAIEMQRFIGPHRVIRRGDPQAALRNAPHQLSGTFHSGGQEQFYLESQAAIAYPGEEGQMVVHSSTQHTTEIQSVVAEMLGLGHHEVVCICKRMGGAFGGKESQAAIPAMMVALVAHHTGRAARVVYDKDSDMRITGKRHQYRTQWSVGFDDKGRIAALQADLYSNGGAAADLSIPVMERSMLHLDNGYYLPDVEINGRICFTNLPPNTAFRGFGGPQAVAAIENIFETIAQHLSLDSLDVRLRNLYGPAPRDVTPYGQVVQRNHLPEIMTQLASTSDYAARRADMEATARDSKLTLRGIAMTPVKFGISFTSKFMNQGNALVNVYTDGTVQVSTGGTEMGQGLNTKIRQLVADEFGLPYGCVLMMPTSTEKNSNTSPTAASAGTDLNGSAAVSACRTIRSRLAALVVERLGDETKQRKCSVEDVVFADGTAFDSSRPAERISFAELAALAHRERVDLGARGFYATPGVDFDRETGQGTPFLYYTQGAAVAEVRIDRFTGELTVPRVDLLIDIGRSINPGVDMGQITGGFIQGMGWVTAECLVYDDDGALLSYSPTTYKIPAITDVPPVFNCRMFDSDDNVENIARSKAVGEPPLMLGISVWAAAKHALSFVAPDRTADLSVPATGEELLRWIEHLAADPAGMANSR